MKDNLPKQKITAPKVDSIHYEPHRVAARMEGVVKNRGTKNIRKQKQK